MASILVGLAGVLRIPALFHDLWLDEVWGAQIAHRVTHVTQVFTSIHADTNHYLYTLYLMLCGADASEPLLRLLSFLAGLLLLGVFWQLRDRNAGWLQFVPLALAGTSFLLVAYASEARGYALLMAGSLCAYALKDSWLRDGRVPALLGFWAACVVGLLSHLTFVIPFAAMGLQSVCTLLLGQRHVRANAPGSRLFLRTVAAYGLPALILGWLYLVDIRHIRIGGGDDLDLALLGGLGMG